MHIRIRLSTAADMPALRVRANSMVNRDEPVSWPPSEYPALHHSPICDRPITERKTQYRTKVKIICVLNKYINSTLIGQFCLPSPVAFAISFAWFSSCLCTVYFETKLV